MGMRLKENRQENMKMFWKDVRNIRKGLFVSEEQVKAEDGRMLVRQDYVRRGARY